MKKLTAIAMALAAALFACSCASNQPAADNGSSAPKEEAKDVRTDLTLYSDLEPETMDVDESVATAVLFRNIYANLYRIDASNQPVPELAEDYSVNKDFTEYTFTLKDDLKFSDGSELTAEDVRYTFKRDMKKGMDYFSAIKNVEAPDKKTVVVTLTEPNNAFLTDVASEHMAVMSKAAIKDGMDVANLPTVTSGAYTVEKWDKKKHTIKLKANPNFLNGEPAIKDVTLLYKLKGTIYDAMQDGTVDYASNIPNDSVDIPDLKAADGIDLTPYDNCSWNYIALNRNKPQYADDNVRRAIACALDLDYIISSALDGQGTAAPLIITGAISGYLPGYTDSPYDVKKAKEYLAASKYPNGFTMTLEIGDTSGLKVAEAVKTLLKEINIDVKIKEEDGNKLVENALTANYDAVFLSYSMYSGNISHAIPLFGKGDLHICQGDDSDIESRMKKSLAVGEEERDKLLGEAYTLMREKWPYIGLYWTTVHDAKVANLKLTEPVVSERFSLSNMYWDQ
ncbi:MAG: ABC transporter substrate-binding protein [Coriobacteriia bacterium]|nr:ABC transporter substrate-binding protein [Coriobacteriia bacterium]